MDLDDLRVFLAVATAGGVSPAARRLGLAKSLVSRRMLKLEDALGVQLLARTARGAPVTEAGAILLEHASRICAELEAMQEQLRPSGDLHGLLRVAAPASFGPVRLAPVFARLGREHPALQIHVRYSDRYVDLVGEGFDCGIRVGYLPSSNLVAQPITTFPMRLYASPAYVSQHGIPEEPGDLDAHSAVLVATETWHLTDGTETIPVRARGRVKADHALALAEAMAAGFGIGALGELVAEPYVRSGKLVPLMPRYRLPPVGMFVVRPAAKHVPRRVKLLTEALLAHFGDQRSPRE